MRTAVRTDIGRIRQVNEDRAVVLPERDGLTVAIVADGMGGHQAGDIASQMAIDAIQEELDQVEGTAAPETLENAVRHAIESANKRIFTFASDREQYQGMGTTVVVAAASKDRLVIGHIGDSRAYLAGIEAFTQLTEDHSLVNELFRSGQITQEEADHHPRRNVLTRALGTDALVEADVHTYTWDDGDIALLCSDGLSGLVDKGELYASLRADGDLEEKVIRLVERALEAGGDDNITVVLIENKPEEKG